MLRRVLSVAVFSVRNYASMSQKRALVLLAHGTEEMEFTITVDILRRAGIKAIITGIDCIGPAKCSRGIFIQQEVDIREAVTKGPFDAVVLPGGLEGAKVFACSEELGIILKDQDKNGRLIAAICAAPLALKAHSIGLGKNITCYPSLHETFSEKYKYSNETAVVQDGHILTSQGPGTAFEFALSIVKEMVGEEKSNEIKKDLLL